MFYLSLVAEGGLGTMAKQLNVNRTAVNLEGPVQLLLVQHEARECGITLLWPVQGSVPAGVPFLLQTRKLHDTTEGRFSTTDKTAMIAANWNL